MKNRQLPELKPKQLKSNYEVLLALIEENVEGERKDKLLKLYDDLSDNMAFAPASATEHYHLAFTGGYCLHVKNVVDSSLLMTKNFKQLGGSIDFTKEELIFSALNHELGKVGDFDHPVYIPQTSDWHRKNRGQTFEFEDNITHMGVTDRSLYLLQKGDVKITQKEWIAIKCSDGMYDEANKTYLFNFRPTQQLDTSLVNIVHWADHMACKVEYDHWCNDRLVEVYE